MDIFPQSHPGAHAVRMETTSSTVKLDMSIIIINNIPPPVSNWGTESDADLSYHNGNNEP